MKASLKAKEKSIEAYGVKAAAVGGESGNIGELKKCEMAKAEMASRWRRISNVNNMAIIWAAAA